ncbi:MAG: aldo/keto reductase [Alphaproteobacteria bacterium]|jgi:aryl-alcohol dehydrogenase-like predicted oxidoreductase|nr:aldo/keto reductase [Alphaproteobacteria bacterium]
MAIEKRPFGRTGHLSSAIIFGAAALGKVDQATADRTLDLLLEHGVNHIDTAPGYGESELRIGPWMDRHRDDFFLATKTRDRGYAEARDSIQRSLERLRVDQVDLLQLHALIHPDEWDVAMGEDGALRAAVEARDAGLVRFIGVTGHGWNVAAMHRRSLERFDFDSVLMPYNWVTAHHATYADDFEKTLEMCRARDVAVQTIKSLARGPWAAGVSKRRTTWYEPLEAEEDIRTAVHYVLARPGIFLNSVGDVGLLPSVLRAAAERIELPDDAAMAAHSERTGLASIFGI